MNKVLMLNLSLRFIGKEIMNYWIGFWFRFILTWLLQCNCKSRAK